LPQPDPAPDPNVKPQPSPQEGEEDEKKKKGCGTKELPHTVLHHERERWGRAIFNVPDGGVTLQISGDWARRFEDSATACPTDDYEVTLHRSNLLLDDDMGTAPVPVGGQSVEWRELPPGDYYFTIVAPPHSPLCCLQGDLAVSTFSAPMPLRMDPMDPSMIA
jgi:hypothetical protein